MANRGSPGRLQVNVADLDDQSQDDPGVSTPFCGGIARPTMKLPSSGPSGSSAGSSQCISPSSAQILTDDRECDSSSADQSCGPPLVSPLRSDLPEPSDELGIVRVHHQSPNARKQHKRRIDEVLSGFLFLSGMRAAETQALVRERGINALLACARDAPLPTYALKSEEYDTLHLQMADAADTELESHFGAAFEFLDAMREAGKRVLVYCREGKSRSASIVIAYLIRTHKLDYGRALEHVRAARKEVDPNFSFCSQLSQYSDSQDFSTGADSQSSSRRSSISTEDLGGNGEESLGFLTATVTVAMADSPKGRGVGVSGQPRRLLPEQ